MKFEPPLSQSVSDQLGRIFANSWCKGIPASQRLISDPKRKSVRFDSMQKADIRWRVASECLKRLKCCDSSLSKAVGVHTLSIRFQSLAGATRGSNVRRPVFGDYSSLVPNSPKSVPIAWAAAVNSARIEPMPCSTAEIEPNNAGTLMRGDVSRNGLEAILFHAPANRRAKALPNVI